MLKIQNRNLQYCICLGVLVCALIFCVLPMAIAQKITEEEAVQLALEKHPQMALSKSAIEQIKTLRPSAFNLPMTELLTEAPAGNYYAFGITQTLPFPGQFVQQRKVLDVQEKIATADLNVNRNLLQYQTRLAYHVLQYWTARYALLLSQDSVLADFMRVSEIRYKVGQTKYIEKINGEAKYRAVKQQLAQAGANLMGARQQLSLLTGVVNPEPDISFVRLPEPNINDTSGYETVTQNPYLDFYRKQSDLSKQNLRLERTKTLPGLSLGYLNQGQPDNPVRNNFRFGVFIPLGFWSYKANLQAAKIGITISQHRLEVETRKLKSQYLGALTSYKQADAALKYFDGIALQQSKELIHVARKSYELGETNYILFLQSLEQAFGIQNNYVDAILNFNQSVLQLNYLQGVQ